jgi:hypothetical protein
MKIGITLISILFAVTMLSAQSVKKEKMQVAKTKTEAAKPVDDSKYRAKVSQTRFNGTVKNVDNTVVEDISLLQQLYLISDERVRVENDKSLSTSERAIRITKNANEYNLKKNEFKKYVSSKGVLNIPAKEQSFYISLLKNDNEEEECKRVIELIKTSK